MDKKERKHLLKHGLMALQGISLKNSVPDEQRTGSGTEKNKESAGETIREHVGDAVEKVIGNTIENTGLEAPVLAGEPKEMTWYRIPLENGISGDGSSYHIYLKKGRTDNLCLFFSGGGVAWNEYTAARPVSGGAVAAGQPNYYWNNLRAFTQIMNINIGITDINENRNPFAEWNFIVIAYATGDFHVGNNDFEYKAVDGSKQVLHFHGKRNVVEALNKAKQYFPSPLKLLIAGDSAGGFAVPANAGMISECFYPDCTDITLFSDSALLPFKHWKKTARDIWKCDEAVWQAIHSENITLDWYEALHKKYGSRFRYLYACSTHDYLLSTYYNDVIKGKYKTDKHIQEEFFRRCIHMVIELKKLEPEFGFFINDWKNILSKGGTIHTAVREPYFYTTLHHSCSMAQWLYDAVNGRIYSVGTELLLTEKK